LVTSRAIPNPIEIKLFSEGRGWPLESKAGREWKRNQKNSGIVDTNNA
jgi:hypothetical protein